MRAAWGGRREGSGRKSKAALAVVDVATVPVAFGPVEMPITLSDGARVVWELQASHAIERQTLIPSTALAFGQYCELVVLERAARMDRPGGGDHRGLLKLIESYEKAFRLNPDGQAVAAAVVATPQDAYFVA